jgi:hypothetical protein
MEINQTQTQNQSNIEFPPIKGTHYIYYIFFTIVAVFWFIIVAFYVSQLLISKTASDSRFLYLMLLISTYPIYIFINNYIEISNSDKLTGLSPYFPICVNAYDTLTQEEKNLNIAAKVDWHCFSKQKEYLVNRSDTITNKTTYAIRTLFTIIIFLFGFGKINTFNYKLITKNSNFVKALIQGACITVLILLTVKYFGVNYYYISAMMNLLYESIYLINITSLFILVIYLFYNLMGLIF